MFDERQVRDSAHEFRYTSTPPDGVFPMHNGGNVQFETPKVPVIFVLGKFVFLFYETLKKSNN